MNDYIYSEKIMRLIRKKKSLLCLTEINDLLNTFFPKYNTYQMKHGESAVLNQIAGLSHECNIIAVTKKDDNCGNSQIFVHQNAAQRFDLFHMKYASYCYELNMKVDLFINPKMPITKKSDLTVNY